MNGRTFVPFAFACCALLSVAEPSRLSGAQSRCDGTDDAAATTPLHCTPLVPTPDLRHVRASLALLPAVTPFGAAVTADGTQRERLVATVHGLPDPATFGAAAYVAWLVDLDLGNAERLATVANGTNDLGTIARNQYRLLVTAERDSAAAQRAGRLVLRATSPSARLLAHRDLAAPAAAMPGVRAAEGDHAAHGGGWTHPPMDPAMPAMPGMEHLVPAVAPFRPGEGRDVRTLPEARAAEVLDVADGDTIDLVAGLVRRTLAGKAFAMYGFNGQHPGPLLRVRQGTEIVVRFRNAAELPSAVHWHGIRLENRFDGVPGVTQQAVAPGETFEYRIRFPDDGIYWYHPHHREDIQQDLGLFGNIRVLPADSSPVNAVHREVPLMLDDLLLGEDGPVPHGLASPTHALMGRFGNVFLTNGSPDWRLGVARGEVVRFLLTNVASARIFNVSFGGLPMKLIGGDIGAFEREEWVESVAIAPAERYVVEVLFPDAGAVPLVNRIQAVDHMLGTYTARTDTLGTVDVAQGLASPDLSATFQRLRTRADVVADVDRYRAHFDRAPDREIHLAMDVSNLAPALVQTMLIGFPPPLDWNDGMPMMNWLMTGEDIRWTFVEPATGDENMDIRWRFRAGNIIKLRLFNRADAFHAMSHPIHVHGQRFLVVARNGEAIANHAWKDTVIVPVGEAVDVLLDLSNPGSWMVHCHVAEHLGTGMMSVFEVQPAPSGN